MAVTVSPRHVWIDDPHAVIRRGMAVTLAAAGFTVVGESDGLKPVPDLERAGLLVFDADGPGLATVLRLVAGTEIGLVATVREPRDAHLHEIARAGVGAILFHEELTPELLVMVARAVSQGRTTLPPGVLPRLLEHASRSSATAPGALTERERDVLRLLAEGHDTRRIALDLRYSERTVKNVVHDVLTKLNCNTRAQAVGMATRAGVI